MPQGLEVPIAPAVEWPKEGNARVPYRMFTDPEVYRVELERLFLGPSWQYLALANELPAAYLVLMKLPVVMHPGEDGWIVVECPIIPGCISQELAFLAKLSHAGRETGA